MISYSPPRISCVMGNRGFIPRGLRNVHTPETHGDRLYSPRERCDPLREKEVAAMGGLKEKKGIFKFFKTAVEEWLGEGPFDLAAALAYYTLFSLSPLLIVLTGIVGLLAGEATAQNYVYSSLNGLVGE